MSSDRARQNATAGGIEPSAIGSRYIQHLGSREQRTSVGNAAIPRLPSLTSNDQLMTGCIAGDSRGHRGGPRRLRLRCISPAFSVPRVEDITEVLVRDAGVSGDGIGADQEDLRCDRGLVEKAFALNARTAVEE
jgi:hypothetical protein